MTPMRIVVAYDASPGSDDALFELVRAGLADDSVALIVAATEAGGARPGGASSAASFGARAHRDPARIAMEHAGAVARCGEERLQRLFPTWKISHEVVVAGASDSETDDVPGAVAAAARAFGASLVVTGSHARTLSGGHLLGSVARRLVSESPCSVRVSRARDRPAPSDPPRPLRVLVAYDASPGADVAVDAAAARRWPPGSLCRVVVVVDPVVAHAGADPGAGGVAWKWLRERSAAAVERLARSGLRAEVEIATGDPRRLIAEDALRFGTDVLFVGAHGAGVGAPTLLGSVASALAATAACTVEVVRPAAAGSP
ncbi:MAG: universal stress protein [Planctomycetes bacterium]|nr:universal stress protein [Planctomycetota bacterium]